MMEVKDISEYLYNLISRRKKKANSIQVNSFSSDADCFGGVFSPGKTGERENNAKTEWP